MEKIIEQHGKPKIEIDPELGRPTEWASEFASTCGSIVRSFAPLQIKGWKKKT